VDGVENEISMVHFGLAWENRTIVKRILDCFDHELLHVQRTRQEEENSKNTVPRTVD
jgi:hypothetical protein